jgi:hypothetical protein
MRLLTSELRQELARLMQDEEALRWQSSRQRAASLKHDALLISDALYGYYIRPTGDVLYCEEDAPPVFVRNDRELAVALTYAIDQYPSIASALPNRPSNALPCSACSGTGQFLQRAEKRCHACVGLGWWFND